MLERGRAVGGHQVEALLGSRGPVGLARVRGQADGSLRLLTWAPAGEIGPATGLRIQGTLLTGHVDAHLTPVAQVLKQEGLVGLLAELPGGGSLAERLQRGARPTLAEVAAVVRAVVDALAGLHAIGIVHGAVCDETVWFRDAGLEQPVLGGLGLGAGPVDVGSIGARFAAPEQLGGAVASEPTADVFAVGRLLERLVEAAEPGDRAIREELLALARRAAAQAPSARPRHAGELAARLDELLPAVGARFRKVAPARAAAPAPARREDVATLDPGDFALPPDPGAATLPPEDDPTDDATVATDGTGASWEEFDWEGAADAEPPPEEAPPAARPPRPAEPTFHPDALDPDDPPARPRRDEPTVHPWAAASAPSPAPAPAPRPDATPAEATWSSGHGVITISNHHEAHRAPAAAAGGPGGKLSAMAVGRVLLGLLAVGAPVGWRVLRLVLEANEPVDAPMVVVDTDGEVRVFDRAAREEPAPAAAPDAPARLEVRQQVEAPYELVQVTPPAELRLGTPEGEPLRRADEAPLTVRARPFLIGKHEVTQGLWARVMGSNPVETKEVRIGPDSTVPCATFGVGDDLPVFCVTWYEAIRFANRLSNLHGLSAAYEVTGADVKVFPRSNGYRLPTEAEFELAARGGELGPWGAFDRATLCEHVVGATRWTVQTYVHLQVADPLDCAHDPGVQPVGSLQPDPVGTHDLLGNVAEWTWDPYDPLGLTDDPILMERRAVAQKGKLARVIRGGSWTSGESSLRPAARSRGLPSGVYYQVGFRLVRGG